MKIRCKNCYRVLNENEDYCTSCGEYSPEMAEYMRTGVRKVSNGDKLKTVLILFGFIAFVGTGAIAIAISVISENVTNNSLYHVMGKLLTSMALIIILTIIFRKEIKGIFFKGTLFQTIGALVLGLVASAVLVITSSLVAPYFKYGKIIPSEILEFIPLDKLSFEIVAVFFVMLLVSVCEEYIYRHRLITFFDEDTMLNDFWIVVLSTLISTVLSFAWFMSIEALIMTVIINFMMTLIYINTNRSIGINILIRCFMYAGVLLLNYIV